MKFLLPVVFILLVTSFPVPAQSPEDSFPTYEQIMPKIENMTDYGLLGRGTLTLINRHIFGKQLFGYPENSVIYYLNG